MIKSIHIQRRKREEIDINVTPLIDVVFLLLIFFMVSTSFKHNADLNVDLPQTKSFKANQQMKGMELGITGRGDYIIDSVNLGSSPQNLERAINAYMAKKGLNKESVGHLMILGDKMAPHQSIVNAMDVAQKLGLLKIKIVTEQKGE